MSITESEHIIDWTNIEAVNCSVLLMYLYKPTAKETGAERHRQTFIRLQAKRQVDEQCKTSFTTGVTSETVTSLVDTVGGLGQAKSEVKGSVREESEWKEGGTRESGEFSLSRPPFKQVTVEVGTLSFTFSKLSTTDTFTIGCWTDCTTVYNAIARTWSCLCMS